MGQQQSKDELLYKKVKCGNIEGIKALRSQGAGLEWIDSKCKTALIVACMNPQLYNAAKTLIELGANVNVYRPGHHAGTPLHHAAKRGLDQTVQLLLSHGANALVMNDDGHTPVELARAKGFGNVVRALEDHLCLFSGWLRELYGPGFLEPLAPQPLSRKVWVVVLPCGSRSLAEPLKLELAIYAGAQAIEIGQDAQPSMTIQLWKANLEEPNFNQLEPAAIITDLSKGTRVKLAPANESEKYQLQRFCNACKGIPQVVQPSFPFNNRLPTAPPVPSRADDEEHASTSNSSSSSHVEPYNKGAASEIHQDGTDNVVSSTVQTAPEDPSSIYAPSAPPVADCTICLDAPLEGPCAPCGHLAECMSCLKEIKEKNWGCPVCRSNIDQIIRIYTV